MTPVTSSPALLLPLCYRVHRLTTLASDGFAWSPDGVHKCSGTKAPALLSGGQPNFSTNQRHLIRCTAVRATVSEKCQQPHVEPKNG